ncbi:MAG: hypothetical protein WBO28_10470 [Flavobacteriales bacterium]
MGTKLRSLCTGKACVLLAILFLATGCITIEEHYKFHEDGSGSMEYVLDMTAMRELVRSMDLEGKNKHEDQGELDLEAQAQQLNGVEGLEHVRFKARKDGYLQRIFFDFKDLAALNRALNVLMPDSSGTQTEFFQWEGNTLVRRNNRHADELGGDPDSLETEEVLRSMKYKYSFKFARGVEEARVAEGMSKESPSARRLELATDWFAIAKEPTALDLRITLGK